jgi:TetR/AcrR family fatty acid metabolism transcriptional regulator
VILEILEEGVLNREIRDDIPAKLIRQIILGSIEQVCLTGITFDRPIDTDALTEDICEIIFNGIIPKTIG